MPHIAITGGPGVGKTTLLRELANLGYRTVPESARAVIAERRAKGLPPRPEPAVFAREVYRRDADKYLSIPLSADWVFFDRSAVEALAMVHQAAPFPPGELQAQLSRFAFHPTVFVLPPWQAIYATDSERDHSFSHCERVHAGLGRWYAACGYRVHEVPCLPVRERAEYVLEVLASSAA
jgi:predicted ATPase